MQPHSLVLLLLLCAASLSYGLDGTRASSKLGGFTPKYCIADNRTDGHLDNIIDVLELLGYSPTDTPADANIIWAWMDPFDRLTAMEQPKLAATHAQLRNLHKHQFVNQFPGLGFLATKPELAKLSAQLKFLPRGFQLPDEYEAWQEFIKTERGAKMEWLQKGRNHRGISIIEDPSAAYFKKSGNDTIVQQLVRPYLIGNRLWDIGVFVAVTSVEPLMAYVHTGGVLLRFCSRDYVRDIKADTPSSTYVIAGLGDSTPHTTMDVMLPHFQDTLNDTRFGTTMALVALRSYLDSQGVDSNKWWLSVQTSIVQALQATTPAMREKQAERYAGQRANFFTLVRFDFMLDENKDVYLIEVNMSPGLLRHDMPLEEHLLLRRVLHDLLVLKGLGPGGHNHPSTPQGLLNLTFHPDAVALGELACAGGCASATDCSTKEACMLCSSCRSEWQNGVLMRVMAEHQGSNGFMRVHPPPTALAQHMEAVGAQRSTDVESSPDDTLVRTWIAAKCKQDFRWC